MDQEELRQRFEALTTPHLADACVRAKVQLRVGPAALHSVRAGGRLAGRVLPARHVGSVDIFLEAFEGSTPGDVLTVDNDGRLDEACVGDMVVREAQAAGLEGLVIWGLHRDTTDIGTIGLPLFSLGAIPTGPQRLDPRPSDALESARIGAWTVGRGDLVLADDDGVLFLPASRADELFPIAEEIRDTERRQADRMRSGVSLRSQLDFDAYLARRRDNPALTLRDHLRAVRGAVEE